MQITIDTHVLSPRLGVCLLEATGAFSPLIILSVAITKLQYEVIIFNLLESFLRAAAVVLVAIVAHPQKKASVRLVQLKIMRT